MFLYTENIYPIFEKKHTNQYIIKKADINGKDINIKALGMLIL